MYKLENMRHTVNDRLDLGITPEEFFVCSLFYLVRFYLLNLLQGWGYATVTVNLSFERVLNEL